MTARPDPADIEQGLAEYYAARAERHRAAYLQAGRDPSDWAAYREYQRHAAFHRRAAEHRRKDRDKPPRRTNCAA